MDEKLIVMIERELINLNITPSYLGYRYICTAVYLALDDETYLYNVTNRLYPEIARIYGTSPGSVERAMRTVIRIMRAVTPPSYQCVVLGRAYADAPGNAKFIAMLTARVRAIASGASYSAR